MPREPVRPDIEFAAEVFLEITASRPTLTVAVNQIRRQPVLDVPSDSPPSSAKRDAALNLLARGFSVIPCHAPGMDLPPKSKDREHDVGKLPLVRWKHYQTERPTATEIRRSWRRWPDANIAVITGAVSGVIVLDEDGPEGRASLAAESLDLPPTWTVESGRDGGGTHRYYRHPGGEIRPKTALLPGVDVKGDGGMAIAPPSVHRTGRPYVWVHPPGGDVPLADAPLWLLDRLRQAGSSTSTNTDASEDDWLRMLQGAPKGERHAVARRIVGHYLGIGRHPAEVEAILIGFAAQCDPVHDFDDVRRIVRDYAAKAPWRAPQPIPQKLPVPAFDFGMLPAVFEPWISDIIDRFQCPPEFVAVPAVIAAASVIGRKVAIRPKRVDDFTVVPNLWGVIIARPGEMKSPAMQEALKPLHQLIPEARLLHERAMAQYAVDDAERKVRRRRLTDELADALEDTPPRPAQSPPRAREAIRADLLALTATSPTERRYIVNDPTVEKLGELLNQNPNGLLLFRDELIGLLNTMDRQGHENDRSFYCEAWTGTNPYTYDRIGRGTLHIDACCLSIMGGIQPGPLRRYLREVFTTGGSDDGLIQRFQLAVYPDRRPWSPVDRGPNLAARTQVMDVFRRLDALTADRVGAQCLSPNELPYLRFAPEAQALFDSWLARLEHQREASDDEHPALVSHFAKYRSLMPSLALIFHLLDALDSWTPGPVSLVAAQRAVAWCLYLEAHARRVYQSITAQAQIGADLLARKITRGLLPNPFTVREVYRFAWSGLSTPGDVNAAVALLEDLDWLRREDVRGTGRPTARFHINPSVLRGVPDDENVSDDEPDEEDMPDEENRDDEEQPDDE